MKLETENGKQGTGAWMPPAWRSLSSAFTLLELLVVMSIMLVIATILVAGYFGMTRAASYTAAETDVFNHLQLARQRASLDGTRVFFLLIDSNSYVLVHGTGQLTSDMDKNINANGKHVFYDAYADLHEITNKASRVRAWNMGKNIYGDNVNIGMASDGPLPTFPGSAAGTKYYRETFWFEVDLPVAAQWSQWKQGDRYGFELYPRQVLPKGFYFGLQDINTFPDNESIVFAADGTSSRVSGKNPPVETRTGVTKLYIFEKIAKEKERAILINIKNPDGAITLAPAI